MRGKDHHFALQFIFIHHHAKKKNSQSAQGHLYLGINLICSHCLSQCWCDLRADCHKPWVGGQDCEGRFSMCCSAGMVCEKIFFFLSLIPVHHNERWPPTFSAHFPPSKMEYVWWTEPLLCQIKARWLHFLSESLTQDWPQTTLPPFFFSSQSWSHSVIRNRPCKGVYTDLAKATAPTWATKSIHLPSPPSTTNRSGREITPPFLPVSPAHPTLGVKSPTNCAVGLNNFASPKIRLKKKLSKRARE